MGLEAGGFRRFAGHFRIGALALISHFFADQSIVPLRHGAGQGHREPAEFTFRFDRSIGFLDFPCQCQAQDLRRGRVEILVQVPAFSVVRRIPFPRG